MQHRAQLLILLFVTKIWKLLVITRPDVADDGKVDNGDGDEDGGDDDVADADVDDDGDGEVDNDVADDVADGDDDDELKLTEWGCGEAVRLSATASASAWQRPLCCTENPNR